MKLLSVIIPAYNEEESVLPLYQGLKETFLKNRIREYEIFFIDDGSRDRTFSVLEKIARSDRRVRVIRLARNYGQTAAISTGIRESRGDVIVLMDADLQNDPADIPLLLGKIREGFGVVSGWRHKRKDPFLTRVLPSRMANFIISRISGVPLKDYGCTLKAYRREYIRDAKLYGEMHRFIPVYARMQGASVTEVKVSHHHRRYGRSKYGLVRIFKVILDLFVIKFIEKYYTKPIYFFGSIGLGLTGAGGLLSVFVLFQKFAHGIWAHKNPFLTLAVMLFILGFQFILFGVLAEIEVRTFFEVKRTPLYQIEKKINLR